MRREWAEMGRGESLVRCCVAVLYAHFIRFGGRGEKKLHFFSFRAVKSLDILRVKYYSHMPMR